MPSRCISCWQRGVYSFDQIKAEAEEAVEHAIPVLGWIPDAWKWLDDVGKLGRLMAFAVIVGLTLKLLFHMACRQMCIWWSDQWEAELRHPRLEEYKLQESLRCRRAREEEEADKDV